MKIKIFNDLINRSKHVNVGNVFIFMSRKYIFFVLPLLDSPRQSPRPQKPTRPVIKQEKDGTPKHEIVVVADGQIPIKDPDPELTKLNAIPVFFPILRGSLNIPAGSKETEILDKLDHKQVQFKTS